MYLACGKGIRRTMQRCMYDYNHDGMQRLNRGLLIVRHLKPWQRLGVLVQCLMIAVHPSYGILDITNELPYLKVNKDMPTNGRNITPFNAKTKERSSSQASST